MKITIKPIKKMGVKYDITAKYADSVFVGFHYRNGKQHPAFDYQQGVFKRFNFATRFAKNTKTSESIEAAFKLTSDQLKAELIRYLSKNRSGMPTLNWWFRKHAPSKGIKMRRKIG